jgi:hypothetical protein
VVVGAQAVRKFLMRQEKRRGKRPAHRARAIADASRRRLLSDGGQRPPMPPSPLSWGGMKGLVVTEKGEFL